MKKPRKTPRTNAAAVARRVEKASNQPGSKVVRVTAPDPDAINIYRGAYVDYTLKTGLVIREFIVTKNE